MFYSYHFLILVLLHFVVKNNKAGSKTIECTTTLAPTSEPTVDPTWTPTTTKWPTKSPSPTPTTTQWPTKWPTKSPQTEHSTPTMSPIPCGCQCDDGDDLDVLFLVDMSCSLPSDDCHNYMDTVSEFLGAIKIDSRPRIAYMTYDDEAHLQIPMTDQKYNDISEVGFGTPGRLNRVELISHVRSDQDYCNSDISGEHESSDLYSALLAAKGHLEATYNGRQQRIALFTSCEYFESSDEQNADEAKICSLMDDNDDDDDSLYLNGTPIDITIVNVKATEHANADDDYLRCLISDHSNEHYIKFSKWDLFKLNEKKSDFGDMVCDNKHDNNGNARIRRLMHEDDGDDDVIMTDSDVYLEGSCMVIELEVNVENLLPNIYSPSASSTILAIGNGVSNALSISGGLTGSTGTVTNLPIDPVQIDESSGQNMNESTVWNVSDDCLAQDNSMEQNWFGDYNKSDTLDGEISENAAGTGFTITTSVTTVESVMYYFSMNSVSLNISTTCDGDNIVFASILNAGTVLANSSESILNVGDTSIDLNFAETVKLSASTTFTILFYVVYADNIECTLSDNFPSYNSNGRRLLASDYVNIAAFESEATSSACTLIGNMGSNSDSMSFGENALCGKADTEIDDLETLLFGSANSQNAMQNHLVSTGSLDLYDSDGELIFNDSDLVSATSPCIVVDNSTGRVWAIGGYDDDKNAVTTIETFSLTLSGSTWTAEEISSWTYNAVGDDGELEEDGDKMRYTKWRLAYPRYGCMCAYYKKYENEALDVFSDYLVVAGGVPDVASIGDSSAYYNDIRMIPLKYPHKGGSYPALGYSFPRESSDPAADILDTATLYATLIDATTWFTTSESGDTSKITFYGGKAGDEFKNVVQSIDLADILSTDSTAAISGYSRGDMDTVKSLPILSSEYINFADEDTGDEKLFWCDAVWAGNSDDDTVDTESMQLYCTATEAESDAVTTVDGRRRLGEKEQLKRRNALRLPKHDLDMFRSGNNRRRLGSDTDSDSGSSIFIQKWNFTNDDVWFQVKSNLTFCYDTNADLAESEQFYDSILKDLTSPRWMDYKETLEESILNVSKDAYDGWSNGFGNVNVTKMRKLAVHYVITPTPTMQKIEKSHPERRKARRWQDYSLSSDSSHSSSHTMWIDGKFTDCDQSWASHSSSSSYE